MNLSIEVISVMLITVFIFVLWSIFLGVIFFFNSRGTLPSQAMGQPTAGRGGSSEHPPKLITIPLEGQRKRSPIRLESGKKTHLSHSGRYNRVWYTWTHQPDWDPLTWWSEVGVIIINVARGSWLCMCIVYVLQLLFIRAAVYKILSRRQI